MSKLNFMGTDIRIVVEKRTAKGWVGFRTFSNDYEIDYFNEDLEAGFGPAALTRIYGRFAALAGVRGGGFGPKPLGLPDDASDTTRLLWSEDCGHNPSWMTLEQAAQIFLKTDADFVRAKVSDPEYFYFGVDETEQEFFRIVFWFDG